jgi:hypothetical protein
MNTDIIATPYERIRNIENAQRMTSERERQRAKEERRQLAKQAHIAAECTPLTEEQWIAKIASLLSGKNIETWARSFYTSMKDDVKRWEWVLTQEGQIETR